MHASLCGQANQEDAMIDQYRPVLVQLFRACPYGPGLHAQGWDAGCTAASIAVESKGPGVGSKLVQRELDNQWPSRNWRHRTPAYIEARRKALQTAIRQFEEIEEIE